MAARPEPADEPSLRDLLGGGFTVPSDASSLTGGPAPAPPAPAPPAPAPPALTAPTAPTAQPPYGRLDPALDPDRFDASREPEVPTGPLDPALDPDRFLPPVSTNGQGLTLEDLLGAGAHEEPRDGLTWLVGLAAVIGFLALMSYIFSNLTPNG